MKRTQAKAIRPGGTALVPIDRELARDQATLGRIRALPKELGVLLVVAGLAGVILPGPIGTPVLLAGGLVLWPRGFTQAEAWFGRHFPSAHRTGLRVLERYINDLEARYPGSAG